MAPPRRQQGGRAAAAAAAAGVIGGLMPVQLSQTSAFEPIKIQTSVLEAQTLEIKPVTSLSYPLSMIEFIARPQDYYLDLSSVYLKLKFQILNPDDSTLQTGNTTDGVVNNLPASMISRVEMYLNEKPVQMCCDNYALRSYLETILNYDNATANTRLQTNIFAKDTAGEAKKATADNLGWTERRKRFFKTAVGGSEATVLHQLHLDVSSASEYFINGLTVRMRIIFHEPAFYMFNAGTAPPASGTATGPAAKTKLKITEAALLLRTKVIAPDVVLQNEARLAQMNARFPIKRVDVRTFVTPSTGRKISLANVYLGSMPNFIAICLMSSAAYAGEHTTNPLVLFHSSISSISVYLNNNCVVISAIDPNDYSGYVPFYHQMMDALSLQGNQNLMISYDEFVNGYFLMCFDLSADKQATASSHISMSMTGSLRIEIELKESLTTNMIAAVYGLFSGVLEINKDRLVSVE